MSAGIPNTSSAYADEGTAAHELAQHCLSTGFDADRFSEQYVNLDGKTPQDKFLSAPSGPRCHLIDAEMADGVQQYLDFVRDIMNGTEVEWEVEQWLSLKHLGIDGLDGGTGDFIAYHPATQTLDVVDLKYGRGVAVDPRENSQGLCYAIGAVQRYHNRGLKKLRISIVQPRCPHPDGPIRTWEADVVDLLDFRAELIDAAKATHEKDAPLAAGEHCRFCPAAATCPERRNQALAIAQAEFSAVGEMELPVVEQMAPAELAKVLRDIDQLEDFCRRVKEYAHNEATHGRMPPGFKLVAKRATRKWRDEASAAGSLEDLYGVTDVWTEPKLKTPAQVEPLLPGKNKAERARALDAFVTKESSGTVLAPVDDPRPAVRADASEFEEAV